MWGGRLITARRPKGKDVTGLNPTLASLNPTLARDGRFYSSLSSYQIKEKAHYYLSLEPRDITDPNASFILVSNKIIRSHTTY